MTRALVWLSIVVGVASVVSNAAIPKNPDTLECALEYKKLGGHGGPVHWTSVLKFSKPSPISADGYRITSIGKDLSSGALDKRENTTEYYTSTLSLKPGGYYAIGGLLLDPTDKGEGAGGSIAIILSYESKAPSDAQGGGTWYATVVRKNAHWGDEFWTHKCK